MSNLFNPGHVEYELGVLIFNAWSERISNLIHPAFKSRALNIIPPSHNENTPIQVFWKCHHQKPESFQRKILIFFKFLLKT